MKAHSFPRLPPAPLLRVYCRAGVLTLDQLGDVPSLGRRIRAVIAARSEWLAEPFLDAPDDLALQNVVCRFYEACVQPALQGNALRRRIGIVRHALHHLLRCNEPLARKAARCLAPDGPYHVAGLGPSFWSAVFQALDPQRHPSWTPASVAGLRRLGLASQDAAGTTYATVLKAHEQLRALAPSLTALHLEHFLALVSDMRGRDLWSGQATERTDASLEVALCQVRACRPLRKRLKEHDRKFEEARRELEAGLANQDGHRLHSALHQVDAISTARAPLDWDGRAEELTLWIGRLWESDDPCESLERFWRADPIPGAGLWLGPAILHLRDPEHFALWDDASREGYALLDDSVNFGGDMTTRYRLFNAGTAWLRERHRIHALELQDALSTFGKQPGAEERYGGFCPDTFCFLAELTGNNHRGWMEGQRERYRFAVREPLVELCRALAERYVEPVLHRLHGWRMDTWPRSGHALTSICKNDYGRTQPYNTVLWIAFCRQDHGTKRADAQFFVRIDAAGVSYGLRVGREAKEAGRRIRRNLDERADAVIQALRERGALEACRFGDSPAIHRLVTGPDDLRAWASANELIAGKHVAADSPLLACDDLGGDVLLTFDRLLPLYACAVCDDPTLFLARRTESASARCASAEEFQRATYLDADWLGRARELLHLKRQLILQGVPGTGKTHVARCLAHLLTDGRANAVRLVQFHPAYCYEEFVEGIKVKSVEMNGRCDVTYPVEDGVLCAFAQEAARHPALPYVLIIDEINRGNLPRIFGELLYLLEYRDQAIVLPYSRRHFRLPANLYVLGTMNAADRSVALIDQALRRRFSFLEMPPDPCVLAAWLREHPPTDGTAQEIVALFERLNRQLGRDLGPQHRIGHSFFMVADLEETRLNIVWEHHVRPQLEEHFVGRAERLANYDLERLLHPAKRNRQPAAACAEPEA